MPTHMNSDLSKIEHDISVIIPTFNRHDSLLETLDSLSQQTLSAPSFEVLVVDDGSTDGTPQIASASFPFALRYIAQQNRGAAAARNRGADISTGRVLVFIDDDITLDPGYLQAILEAHCSQPNAVGMGVFQPYLNGRDTAFAVLNARQVAAKSFIQNDELVTFTECSSNNLAVARGEFFAAGMWHDIFGDGPTLWGDVEFGYRVWKQGLKFLRVASAKLYHRDHHVENMKVACRRAYHVSRTVHFLFQKYPEITQHIVMFQDKHPISLRSDSPNLVIHKFFHAVTACPPGLWAMERLMQIVESTDPESRLLDLLYQWIVSAYIFRGYRQGLSDLTAAKV